ncbi:MAG: chorismate mutase [Bacteroidales bacterium]|nr:chorismate mutase [Bacteroidales bacterium]
MKLPNDCTCIEDVREEIDAIDNEIIGLIGKRLSFIREIMKYKNNVEEVYATDRYNAVILKRRELAMMHHLDPDIIENLYRILMDYFIQEQLELLKKKT